MNSQHIIPIFVAGSVVLALFGFFFAMYLVTQKNKQNRFALQKQQLRLEVNESTMNQISLEIHDNVGQILFLAEMNTSSLSGIVHNETARDLVNETGKLIRQAIADLRNISHSLNSEQIKQLGLVEALKRDVQNIPGAANLDCSVTILGDQVRLPSEKELMVFRIAQEAISNALKHSNANKLDLTLNYEKGKVALIVSDNGKGFNKDDLQQKKGIGLTNMSQRAHVLDGIFDIESCEGEGCKVKLTVTI